MGIVSEFINSKDALFDYFDCHENYYVKIVIDCDWCIKSDSGVSFLCYWDDKTGARVNAVIVRRDGNPIIYKKNDYTMVIAIECIKIAFILDSARKSF